MRLSWPVLCLLLSSCAEVSLTGNIEGDAAGECLDRIDNDRDGTFDCGDGDCALSPDCTDAADTDAADTDDTVPPDTDTTDTDSGVVDTDAVDTDVADTDVVDTDVVDTDPPIPADEFFTPGVHTVVVPVGATSVVDRKSVV